MTVAFYLIGALLLILLSGLFVALEFSLITSSESFLRERKEAGDGRADYALLGMKRLPRYLAGAQFGITITTLALGFIAEPAVAELFELAPFFSHAVAAILALVVVTFMQMVLGEIVPKNLALAAPEKTALVLAGPQRMFVSILAPIIWALDTMSALGVRLLGVSADEEAKARTPVELMGVVKESFGGGIIDKFDHDLLAGALDLGEQTVGRHMVFRPRIVSIKPKMTIREIEEIALASGHSRLPIIENEATSFVHAKDLLSISEEARDQQIPDELIRPILSLDPDCPLDDALVLMKSERCHLAVVHDSRQNIIGLITIEDVLESLVGDFPED